MMDLNYNNLFGRNLGIFTADEQERIRDARVVIIGDSAQVKFSLRSWSAAVLPN